MINDRREFMRATSSTLCFLALFQNTRRAFGVDCSTWDPFCVIESAGGGQIGSSDFGDAIDDSSSDLAGSVFDDGFDDDSDDPDAYDPNPVDIESQIQVAMLSTTEVAQTWAKILGSFGLGLSLAGVPEVGIPIELAGWAIDIFAVDPATPDTSKIRKYTPPSASIIISSSPSAMPPALQTTGFHALGLAMAVSSTTTSHERYLGAVQQAATKAIASNVAKVQAQAAALASNASACSNLCNSLASDMLKIELLLPALYTGAKRTTNRSKIAANFTKAWPLTRAILQNTYKCGPKTLAYMDKIAIGFANFIRTNKTGIGVIVGGQNIAVGIPPTVRQLTQLTSTIGHSLPDFGTKFTGIATTISSANWPKVPGPTPPPSSCPSDQQLINGVCRKSPNG